MSDETFIPGPRHDYICTRCEEKGLCSPEAPWRDLPARAARCPQCGAKKFMQIIYGGYTMRVSGTGLTPTHLGSEANGQHVMQAVDQMGPEFDRQRDIKSAARHAQIHNPWAPKLVGAAQLASVIPGMPLAMPSMTSDPARALPVPRGVSVPVIPPGKIAKTNVAARYAGDGT